MEDILVLLQHVAYPATRQDLIDAAAATDPPPAAMARLLALENRQYADMEDVSRDLVGTRAESNPALVAITAEVCEHCGFAHMPGEPHSCIEEKARFAESVNSVTDTFDTIDESAAKKPSNEG